MAGACRIWQCSEEKNRLRYTTFLGDGDSKSFSAVSQEVSYPVAKIDCVGYVQKRLGTRKRKCLLHYHDVCGYAHHHGLAQYHITIGINFRGWENFVTAKSTTKVTKIRTQ